MANGADRSFFFLSIQQAVDSLVGGHEWGMSRGVGKKTSHFFSTNNYFDKVITDESTSNIVDLCGCLKIYHFG